MENSSAQLEPGQETPMRFVIAELNARIEPMARGALFEDPLTDELGRAGIGEVTGGGTKLGENGEIEFCEIEIELTTDDPRAADVVVELLNRLGAPKGSKLTDETQGREIAFGVAEGMAVYLNGTDLPAEVYRTCDPNFVVEEFERLLGDTGFVLGHWRGPKETALYIYGGPFEYMKEKLAGFIASYPLCQRCRVEQIA